MRRNHKEKKRLLSQAALARSSSLRVKTPSQEPLQAPDIPPGRMPTGREKGKGTKEAQIQVKKFGTRKQKSDRRDGGNTGKGI